MTSRQPRHASSTAIATLSACLFLWGVQSPAWAEGATDVKPLALRKIKQELGRIMQAISGAISQEDWTLVAKLAPTVAAPPAPPLTEKMRILTYLGTNAAKFRGFDEKTHEAAHAMEQAAERGEGTAVIQAYARVQESCLGCHQSFRKSFVEHFYGQR